MRLLKRKRKRLGIMTGRKPMLLQKVVKLEAISLGKLQNI